MAEYEDITEFQSFSERTLKYGRNLIVASVPMIIFGWTDVVDLKKSRPFNFEIKPGEEIWIWYFLISIVLYYGLRFFWLAILDYLSWRQSHSQKFSSYAGTIRGRLNECFDHQKVANDIQRDIDRATKKNDAQSLARANKLLSERIGPLNKSRRQLNSDYITLNSFILRRYYFWIFDALLPGAFFAAATIAALRQIF